MAKLFHALFPFPFTFFIALFNFYRKTININRTNEIFNWRSIECVYLENK